MAEWIEGRSGDMPVRVPRRFVTSEDRLGFQLVGAWAIVEGALQLMDPSANGRLWLAPVWPVMLIVGGVMTIAFAQLGMHSFTLRKYGAALLVLSCAGRAGALTAGIVADTAHSVWSALAGFGVWSFVAFLLFFTFATRLPTVKSSGNDGSA